MHSDIYRRPICALGLLERQEDAVIIWADYTETVDSVKLHRQILARQAGIYPTHVKKHISRHSPRNQHYTCTLCPTEPIVKTSYLHPVHLRNWSSKYVDHAHLFVGSNRLSTEMDELRHKANWSKAITYCSSWWGVVAHCLIRRLSSEES